jgi:hypothetical protein
VKNGWLHIREAKRRNYAGYLDDKDTPRVLVWVVGIGVAVGAVYETEQGLIYVVPGYRGQRIAGWQPCPLGPTTAQRKKVNRQRPI